MLKTICPALARSALALAALTLAAAAPASAATASPELRMFRERNFGGAAMTLTEPNSNLNFSARSVQVGTSGAWQLCPRPFFGGTCIRVENDTSNLSLPRAFSGTVKSARPVASAAPAEETSPAEAKQDPPGR